MQSYIIALYDTEKMSMKDMKDFAKDQVDHYQPEIKIYEHSYRMEPKEGEKFLKSTVEKEIKAILENHLKGKNYSVENAPKMNNELCKLIMDKLKTMNYPRYKMVVQVITTSATGQNIRVASRCLWDPKVDNYASAIFSNV